MNNHSCQIRFQNLFLIQDTNNLLGSGAYGRVYKGTVEGHGEEVAVKMTLKSNATSSNLKTLLSEIKVLIHVGKHPNVVSIIGAYTSEVTAGIVIIAIELCPGGSLEKRLRKIQLELMQANQKNSSKISSETLDVQLPDTVPDQHERYELDRIKSCLVSYQLKVF